MGRERIIERERRWAVPAAVFALVPLVLYIISIFVVGQAHLVGGSSEAAQLTSLHDNSGTVLISSVIRGIGFLLLPIPFLYLFRAAQARSTRVQAAMVGFVFIGPILFGAQGIVQAIGAGQAASDFVNRPPEQSFTLRQVPKRGEATPGRDIQGDDLHRRRQARGRADRRQLLPGGLPQAGRGQDRRRPQQTEHRYRYRYGHGNRAAGRGGEQGHRRQRHPPGLPGPPAAGGPRPGRADGLRPAAGVALRPGHQVPRQPRDGARRLDDPHPADRRAGDARLDRLPRPHLRRPGARRATTRLGRRQGHPMAAAGRPGDRGQQRRRDRGRRDRGRRGTHPAIRGRRRARPRSASARVAARPRPALA